jgi:hypothetical protein
MSKITNVLLKKPEESYAVAEQMLYNKIQQTNHKSTIFDSTPNENENFIFTDKILKAVVEHLPNLKKLVICGCAISNNGIEYISNLSKLEFLEILHSNKITSGFKWISTLKKLKYLSIGYTKKLKDEYIAYILKHCNEIQCLKFNFTTISGVFLHDHITKPIIELHINSINISTSGMIYISKLPTLQKLTLSRSCGKSIKLIKNIIHESKHLEYLSLLCVPITADFFNIKNNSIKILEIKDCPEITTKICEYINSWSKLEKIDIVYGYSNDTLTDTDQILYVYELGKSLSLECIVMIGIKPNITRGLSNFLIGKNKIKEVTLSWK